MINGSALTIAGLTRDGVCDLCADIPEILSPETAHMVRDGVRAIAEGRVPLSYFLDGGTFPIIIRPLDSHAGQDLEKIDAPEDLQAYLATKPDEKFYITQFVDYSGPDGLFRKQRVAFIKGKPYISHMAVSENWMVHYLNAGMDEKPERRAEEAAFMDGFDEGFAVRHAKAFESLCNAIDLEYFGIDCAEMPDGRLLVFEADVAMIIHSMDSPDLYPYKPRAMAKLFNAVIGLLEAEAETA
ncbi:MAG: hypothetical protein CGW95_10465 [Phenylobacterium zucineum]|nr:MAG: hypothetical protein CGW95_10465 [Phenylobacterium zucineum]